MEGCKDIRKEKLGWFFGGLKSTEEIVEVNNAQEKDWIFVQLYSYQMHSHQQMGLEKWK